jgi:hypothetical protein
VDRLLGEWRIPKDSEIGRQVFREHMERRRQEDTPEEFGSAERGWYLAGELFRQELLDQVHVGPGPSHYGQAVQEAVFVRAERFTTDALKRMGLTEDDLKWRRKGDPDKVRLARELRTNTTMPLAWIAHRLHMGTRGHLAWLLNQKTEPESSTPSGQCAFNFLG